MANNQALIDRLRSAMKDTPPGGATTRVKRSDATYATFLTDGQSFLNENLELCRKEFELELEADEREYQLDSSFVKFPTDRMKKRAGLVYWASGNLEPADAADLDGEATGWRNLAAATPRRFYVQRALAGNDLGLILGLDRTPDSNFLASPGNLTYYGVYRPADIAANDDMPFDNSSELQGLDNLLILHSLVFLEAEDGNLNKAEERWRKFLDMVEAVSDKYKAGGVRAGRGPVFDRDWKR